MFFVGISFFMGFQVFFAYLLKSPWSIFDGRLYDLTDLLLKIEGKNRVYSPLQQACLFMLSQLSSNTIKVSVHFQSFIDSSAPLDSFTAHCFSAPFCYNS